MRFSSIVIVALATLVLAGSANTGYAQVKIGVVDLQRAINETEDGRQAKRRLKKLFDERQKSLDAKQLRAGFMGMTMDAYTCKDVKLFGLVKLQAPMMTMELASRSCRPRSS